MTPSARSTPAHPTLQTAIELSDQALAQLLDDLSRKFEVLRPQSIRPAEEFIKHDYLIPAGFYKQMWDWDGFFIGCHLISQDRPDYLQGWVLNFVNAIDDEGYVAGCVTTEGPRPLFGKFAMKPFLSQGAYLAATAMQDFSWLEEIYAAIVQVCAYREATQYDETYGLFFWDNAMQSGADNNVVLTNDDRQRSAILAVDINVLQYREYLAMEKITARLDREDDAVQYQQKAQRLKAQIAEYHWYSDDKSFWNIRRRDGRPVKRVSYSNFMPLIQPDLLSREDGRAMIERYLWRETTMLAPYGLRTLSKQDPDYNNENIIVPYSNWQGPVWPIANYLYSLELHNYGFDQETRQLAMVVGSLVAADIDNCGSMHENYHAETGAPLAPTAEQSKDGVFTGFVGWNLLIENLLRGVVEDNWLLLTIG